VKLVIIAPPSARKAPRLAWKMLVEMRWIIHSEIGMGKSRKVTASRDAKAE